MKNIIALAALLGFATSAMAAGHDGAFSHSGQYQLTYENTDNADFKKEKGSYDRQQLWKQRFRFNTNFKASEKMAATLNLVHNGDWGNNASQKPDEVAITSGSTTAETSNLLLVNEAYMTWMFADDMLLKVGRGSATIGDGTVVSENDTAPVKKAFDGVALVHDAEFGKIMAFGVAGAKAADTTQANEWGRYYGLTFDAKGLPDVLKMAHVHYMIVRRDLAAYEIGGSKINLNEEKSARYGLSLGGDAAGVDYRFAYNIWEGEQRGAGSNNTRASKIDIDTDMWELEVGYSMPDMMKFRVHALYHTDSGDKDSSDDAAANQNTRKQLTYNPFHYESDSTAGWMNVLGWGNLTYTKLGVALDPMEDLTVSLDYYMFTKTEKSGSSYGEAGYSDVATALSTAPDDGVTTGNTATPDDDELGQELDLSITHKYASNFKIEAAWRKFMVGDAFRTATNSSPDDTEQYWLQATLGF